MIRTVCVVAYWLLMLAMVGYIVYTVVDVVRDSSAKHACWDRGDAVVRWADDGAQEWHCEHVTRTPERAP